MMSQTRRSADKEIIVPARKPSSCMKGVSSACPVIPSTHDHLSEWRFGDRLYTTSSAYSLRTNDLPRGATMSDIDPSPDLIREAALNHRLNLDHPGRSFTPVTGSRWGELI